MISPSESRGHEVLHTRSTLPDDDEIYRQRNTEQGQDNAQDDAQREGVRQRELREWPIGHARMLYQHRRFDSMRG